MPAGNYIIIQLLKSQPDLRNCVSYFAKYHRKQTKKRLTMWNLAMTILPNILESRPKNRFTMWYLAMTLLHFATVT